MTLLTALSLALFFSIGTIVVLLLKIRRICANHRRELRWIDATYQATLTTARNRIGGKHPLAAAVLDLCPPKRSAEEHIPLPIRFKTALELCELYKENPLQLQRQALIELREAMCGLPAYRLRVPGFARLQGMVHKNDVVLAVEHKLTLVNEKIKQVTNTSET